MLVLRMCDPRRLFPLVLVLASAFLYIACSESRVKSGGPATAQTRAMARSPFDNGALDRWTWRYPPEGNSILKGAAFLNGAFFAVGESGTILSSTDGIAWYRKITNISEGLWGIAYGNGTFVAVGDGGVILTSTDGQTWTRRSDGYPLDLHGVVYGNGTFVAVGWNQYTGTPVFTSTDGITWTRRYPPISRGLSQVAWGNGLFVAIGEYGKIVTSPDGATWTERTSGVSSLLLGITYGNGIFMVVGGSGTILTSSDGITWELSTSQTSLELDGVSYGSGIFTVVGTNGYVSGGILTSADGTSWKSVASWPEVFFYGVCSGNGMFVAVGRNANARCFIVSSTDGSTWTDRTHATRDMFSRVLLAGGKFVGIMDSGLIWNSTTGADWSMTPTVGYYPLYGLAYGNGTYVATGLYGVIGTSSDGAYWTGVTSGTSQTLRGAVYDNGLFVAVGDGGTVVTSPDGTNWTPRTSGIADTLSDVTHGNGLFVAVGGAVVATSPDGMTWTTRWNGGQLKRVSYGRGLFVAVGDAAGGGDIFLTSPDGITWTSGRIGLRGGLGAVAYGNGYFVAAGPEGVIVSSPDGRNWTLRNTVPPISENLYGIAYGKGTFLVLGTFGAIVQSGTLPPGMEETFPADNAMDIPGDSVIRATFSDDMDPSSINGGTFILTSGGVPVAGTVTCEGATATFTPSAPLPSDTLYMATVTSGAKSLDNVNMASDYTWRFSTVWTTPLSVKSTLPAAGARNVPAPAAIRAVFSETLDPSSVNSSTFLVGSGGVPVTGSVSCVGPEAVFTPTPGLSNDRAYTVVLTTEIRTPAGKPLAGNFSWDFSTLDTIPPAVASVSPSNNATSVPVTERIKATFSEPVDPSTISTETFSVYDGAAAISGSVSYGGTTAVFTPDASLSFNKTYTAKVTSGVKDPAGNPMAADYTWNFTVVNSTAPSSSGGGGGGGGCMIGPSSRGNDDASGIAGMILSLAPALVLKVFSGRRRRVA